MKKIIISIVCLVLLIANISFAKIDIIEPMTRQVFQRNNKGYLLIDIKGIIDDDVKRIDARSVVMIGSGGRPITWRTLARNVKAGEFSGKLKVFDGGWYKIEIRSIGYDNSITSASVEKVGIGEVFVTAGQSNSTNFGGYKSVPIEDRVSAWDGSIWQLASDPQPIASDDGAKGGSPWPILGDILVQQLNVPVGFISVGWGGSGLFQWNADGLFYPRMKKALEYLGNKGARAILWHQGETDMVLGTSTDDYKKLLGDLIDQSRKDAGWNIPWMIAGVSYMPPEQFGNDLQPKMDAIRKAQKEIVNNITILEGPTTDDMIGPEWRSDTVHFNQKGLTEHAFRWSESIMNNMLQKYK